MKKNLIKVLFVLFLLFHSVPPVHASFLYEDIVILDKEQIVALPDEVLIDDYLAIVVEIEAMKTFYFRAGFTPTEYKSFKNLLKYRVNLLMEMQRRKLDIPRLS